MSQLTNSIGINVSEENVQLVEIIKQEEGYCIEYLDEEFFEESITQLSKEAKYIHILQNAFNEIILRKPLNSDYISITLPPSFFNVHELPIDKNLTKTDLDEYIRWEISKIFPTKKSNYFAFDKIIVNPLKFESYKRVLIYLIPINFLKLIHKFSVRNNLKLKHIDNAHTAAVSLFMKKRTELSALSLFIEYNTLSYFFIRDGSIFFELTKKYKSISEITEITQRVSEEVKHRKLTDSAVDKIILFGNFITDELKHNLRNSLNISLEEINPFSNLPMSDLLNGNISAEMNELKYSPALAAALRI